MIHNPMPIVATCSTSSAALRSGTVKARGPLSRISSRNGVNTAMPIMSPTQKCNAVFVTSCHGRTPPTA